jgi:hypothetical protein
LEATRVFIEGVDLGQDMSQDPEGPNQHQEQPWGGGHQPQIQPGRQNCVILQGGWTDNECLRPRRGTRTPGHWAGAETVSDG